MKTDAPEPLDKSYDPKQVESKWYTRWTEAGYFHAEIDPDKTPYSIVIPPPNVTGSLHMGHALNNTLQDIIIRKKRMQGFSAMWLPGTDHAGIATQNVVERELAKEGLKRQDLGRDGFNDRVWEWKEQYGETIINQLKVLGCSCDWDRERFTFDEPYTHAVKTVFKTLYDQGLIYRGSYIINWCPRCRTALSDIEVEHEDKPGHLWHIKYPVKDSDLFVIVATTRPETMLGDTAVAVNPIDKRYKDYIGKTLILPLVNREIPVIADDFVDMEFGTGAVKVTPSHDPNDFDLGERHDLPHINIFTEDAVLNELAGPYKGLDRYEGRKAVLNDLEAGGYLEKEEDHAHSVGHCYRCHTEVEPYESLQWFVKMKPLAEPAIAAVKDGTTTFHPKRWEKTYYEWMDNIRDWCISRQLWWGHRIPVWYCSCGETIVAVDEPQECPSCGSGTIKQDEDVLDTWFSSWLWPFATMGWPDKTPDLEYFYPTDLLSTAFDIIFFWVARMMMAGLHFTGEVPFKDVYVHALIRDAHGAKMSKSKGNVIDPLDVLEWSGTDALRFTLASLAVPGRDVILSEDRIEGYRHFVNKLWNASRFVFMNMDGYDMAFVPTADDYTVADRWILSRLNVAINSVEANIEKYNFSGACGEIYSFIWNEYCDWYIEISKNRLYGDDARQKNTAMFVLMKCLDQSLKLLHPVMPFVTEEIWQKIPGAGDSIMMAEWPVFDTGALDTAAEREIGFVIDLVNAIRQIKHETNISGKQEVILTVFADEQEYYNYIVNNSQTILRLSKINAAGVVAKLAADKAIWQQNVEHNRAVKFAISGVEGFIEVKLEDAVDTSAQVESISARLAAIETDLSKLKLKLENEQFVSKASAEAVQKVRDKAKDLNDIKEKLENQLRMLRG